MRRFRWLLLTTAMLAAMFIPVRAAAQAERWTVFNTPFPQTIRVAVRESRPSGEPDPRGRIIYVMDVPFDRYCKESLPHEWYPTWNPESLQAGAMAVKMFAWYHVLNPTTLDGYTFDVDNTVNFQTYREGARTRRSDAAYDAVRHLAYADRDGTIEELNYRAGIVQDPNYQYRNANKMAQWGSQYWAERGYTMLRILQFFYQGRDLHPIPGLSAGGAR